MVWVDSDKFRSTGGYGTPSGKLLGLMGLSGEERGPSRRWRVPPCPNPNWTRGGDDAPLSLSYSSLSLFAISKKEKGEGNPTWTRES